MSSMLIIDGSETIAKLFAGVFEKLSWDISVCNDRDCAIERLLASESYDVILLSYVVPGTNGVQLIRFIRSLEHRRMSPVLMVTSCGEVADEAKAAGADDVLLKPVNVNALIWAVGKHVPYAEHNES